MTRFHIKILLDKEEGFSLIEDYDIFCYGDDEFVVPEICLEKLNSAGIEYEIYNDLIISS